MERFENEKSLRKRVEQLERIVAELQSALKQIHKESSIEKLNVAKKATGTTSAKVDPNRAQDTAPSKINRPTKTAEPVDKIRKNEYWLNKIGIGYGYIICALSPTLSTLTTCKERSSLSQSRSLFHQHVPLTSRVDVAGSRQTRVEDGRKRVQTVLDQA